MQIAASSAPTRPLASTPPAGWAPESIRHVPATRRTGMLPAMWDAVRGVQERGDGQALSAVQVATLGAFLARAWEMPLDQTLADLAAVRIYIGGPAAGKPFLAVQVDHSLYVGSEAGLDRILGWGGRRWLAHELGHVMQWRRSPGASDLARTRHGVSDYLLRYPAGFASGTAHWLADRLRGGSLKHDKAVHDAHATERETERHAQEFLAETS